MTLGTPAKPPGQRLRRNVPVIPDQRLPATGRRGRAPDPPFPLRAGGQRWWKWVWATPQATQFNKGHLDGLARRADLEDDLEPPAGDISPEMAGALVDRRLKIVAQMSTFDDRFGLSPYGAARLHWWIEKDDSAKLASVPAVGDLSAKQRAKDLGARAVAGS